VKASVFRRWPVIAPYRGEQTTRLTGGYDFFNAFTRRRFFCLSSAGCYAAHYASAQSSTIGPSRSALA